jgi:hypothetical protein
MFSRRSEGCYAVRRYRDIRTGRWTTPSLDGTPVVFPHAGDGRRAIRPVAGLAGTVVRRTMPLHGELPVSPRNALRATAGELLGPLRR